MKVKIIKILLLSILMFGCSEEAERFDSQLEPGNFAIGNFSFDKENNILHFKSREELKNNLSKGISLNRMENFYIQGFIPSRIIDGFSEEKANELAYIAFHKEDSKFGRFSTPNFSEDVPDNYEVPDVEDDLISNEEFAALLNKDREIVVNDSIFKYTSKGVLFSRLEKIKDLRKIKENEIPSINSHEGGLISLPNDPDINLYVPNRSKFNEYEMFPPEKEYGPIEPEKNENEDSYGIPKNMKYENCTPGRNTLDNIFGRTYDCTYNFTSKRKLRSLFAVEDYYLFYDVYAQGKFKKKTWFGWYSSRDASKVFVRVKKSMMTFNRRNADTKITTKQIEQFASVMKKSYLIVRDFLAGSSKNEVLVLSDVVDKKGVKLYDLNRSDLIGINNSFPFNSSDLVVPKNHTYHPLSDKYSYKKLIGGNVNKLLVIDIFGKERTILSDKQLYEKIYNFLENNYKKIDNDNLTDKIAVLARENRLDSQGKVKSYIRFIDFGKSTDIVHGYAVARRTFKFDKEVNLDELTIFYNSDTKTESHGFGIKASWNTPDSWEFEIQTGALYKGEWGGSSFKVKR
uniref:hypothetical protein n=1 Tax=Ornithobacterium rhinotracheale TaxID=28251 RepID=UPI0039A67E97